MILITENPYGDILLAGNETLTHFPLRSVRRHLDLEECPRLRTLAPNLTVGGWLDLSECPCLTKLPNGIIVGREIWVDRSAVLPTHIQCGALWVDDNLTLASKGQNDTPL